MMFLLVDLVTLILSLVIWWLVHENAKSPEPFALVISVGYSIYAMLLLAEIFFHLGNSQYLIYTELAARAVLAVTLAAVAARLHRLHG